MERLEQILEEGKKETAVDAAISIIRKNNPDLLDEDKVNEYLRVDSK